jgi:hypothetical protein
MERVRILVAAALAVASVVACGGTAEPAGDVPDPGAKPDGATFDVANETVEVDAAEAEDPAADLAGEEPASDAADGAVETETYVPETGLATMGRLYAHSSDRLYEWVPGPAAPKDLGAFQWPSDNLGHQMTDLAIDYDGRMYGISFDGIYRVNAQTAQCLNLATLSEQFNGLTVVPKGTVQASVETIVAISNAGGWYRVDVQGTKAKLTPLGSYGSGYSSAGDAYSIEGIGTFAAVNSGFGGTMLVKVDPVTGKVVKEMGTIPGDAIYGLAGLGNKAYAFDASGEIYVGDVTNTDTFTSILPASKGAAWWGAGVTTRGK